MVLICFSRSSSPGNPTVDRFCARESAEQELRCEFASGTPASHHTVPSELLVVGLQTNETEIGAGEAEATVVVRSFGTSHSNILEKLSKSPD